MKQALYDHLASFISDNRRDLFDRIVQSRTRHLTVMLENIFQPQNASAVLRSCDCFGIQDAHIVENSNEYVINPKVAMGATKWLNLHRYSEAENNTLAAMNALKAKGYKLVATTPHTDDCLLDDLPLDQPVALMFGTELTGLSDLALEHADAYMRIPMYGFTESFNISVSAALSIHHLTEKLKKSEIDWQLPEEEQLDIKLDWVRSMLRRADIVEKTWLAEQKGAS